MTRPYVLIAGGAGKLGREVVGRLLTSGEDVVVLDKRPCEGLETTDVIVDLVDEYAVEAAIAELVAERGAPRALVNSQGWSPKSAAGRAAPAAEFDVSLFRQVLDVNLTSCFATMRSVVPQMAGGGRVVNVGSAAAYTGRTTATCAYSAAKAGLDALTRAYAVQYAAQGVLVCGVAPGKFVNPDWSDDATVLKRYKDEIPIGRLASVAEVAEVIIFLASPTNTYITGQTVIVDGGRLA